MKYSHTEFSVSHCTTHGIQEHFGFLIFYGVQCPGILTVRWRICPYRGLEFESRCRWWKMSGIFGTFVGVPPCPKFQPTNTLHFPFLPLHFISYSHSSHSRLGKLVGLPHHRCIIINHAFWWGQSAALTMSEPLRTSSTLEWIGNDW